MVDKEMVHGFLHLPVPDCFLLIFLFLYSVESLSISLSTRAGLVCLSTLPFSPVASLKGSCLSTRARHPEVLPHWLVAVAPAAGASCCSRQLVDLVVGWLAILSTGFAMMMASHVT